MQADLSKNSPRKRKLKTLQQQKRRQKVKINGLNSIIKTLSNFCQKKPVKICLSNFGTSKTLIENDIKNNKLKRRTYSDELKKFTTTVHFYSPRA